mgnify:CR=1 FL=1
MNVRFDEHALQFLQKLPFDIRRRIISKIERTISDPFHFWERLSERTDYKLRIGDYRAIAEIHAQAIHVTKIGHRKNIYADG